MKIAGIISAAVMLLMIPVNAAAEDVLETSLAGISYRYTENPDGTVTVVSADIPPIITEITLPSQLDGKEVSEIGSGAYRGSLYVEKITVPPNIKSIGTGAFMSCSSLQTVIMEAPLTRIPDECFFACSKLEIINIPDTVQSIGTEAFHGCAELDITIPASVESIGTDAVGRTADFHNSGNISIYGFLIKGVAGSTAEAYADENGIDFVDPDNCSYGNVNGDTFIDATDASAVLSEYSRISTGIQMMFTKKQQFLADMDKDGMIDSSDASAILIKYAQLSTGQVLSTEIY